MQFSFFHLNFMRKNANLIWFTTFFRNEIQLTEFSSPSSSSSWCCSLESLLSDSKEWCCRRMKVLWFSSSFCWNSSLNSWINKLFVCWPSLINFSSSFSSSTSFFWIRCSLISLEAFNEISRTSISSLRSWAIDWDIHSTVSCSLFWFRPSRNVLISCLKYLEIITMKGCFCFVFYIFQIHENIFFLLPLFSGFISRIFNCRQQYFVAGIFRNLGTLYWAVVEKGIKTLNLVNCKLGVPSESLVTTQLRNYHMEIRTNIQKILASLL